MREGVWGRLGYVCGCSQTCISSSYPPRHGDYWLLAQRRPFRSLYGSLLRSLFGSLLRSLLDHFLDHFWGHFWTTFEVIIILRLCASPLHPSTHPERCVQRTSHSLSTRTLLRTSKHRSSTSNSKPSWASVALLLRFFLASAWNYSPIFLHKRGPKVSILDFPKVY